MSDETTGPEPEQNPEAQDAGQGTQDDASADPAPEATEDAGAPEEPATAPEDPNAVLPASESAPANADTTASYVGVLPDVNADTAPVPLADQPDQPDNLLQTPETTTGYIGTVPTSEEERESMTLSAQAAKAQEQYGDGKPETLKA